MSAVEEKHNVDYDSPLLSSLGQRFLNDTTSPEEEVVFDMEDDESESNYDMSSTHLKTPTTASEEKESSPEEEIVFDIEYESKQVNDIIPDESKEVDETMPDESKETNDTASPTKMPSPRQAMEKKSVQVSIGKSLWKKAKNVMFTFQSIDGDFLSKLAAQVQEGRREEAALQMFDSLDLDRTGTLDKEELVTFFRQVLERQRFKMEPELLEMAVELLIEEVGGQDDDATTISKEEFLSIFQRHPDMYKVFDNPDQAIPVREDREEDRKAKEINEGGGYDLWNHAQAEGKDKCLYVFWMLVYLGATTGIFTTAAIKWANTDEATEVFGNCIIVARASAATLNFHAALVLLPIARHFITWLYSTPISPVLFPLAGMIQLHIVLGIGFALFTTSHVLAHACDYTRFALADQEDLVNLLGTDAVPSTTSGRLKFLFSLWASITGIVMVVIMIIAYAFIPKRRKYFMPFWSTHHLLLVMLILMCVHGAQSVLQHYRTIYWIAIPLSLYIIPRFYREIKCWNQLKVIKAEVYHSTSKRGNDVLDLRVSKPFGWKTSQKPGMYAFVNVPAISKTEWHPFTISSAPCQDFVGFHIQKAGDWTANLHKLVLDSSDPEKNGGDNKFAVRIEGPIGASTQEFDQYPVVVLIGAGIGVTPMVSVVQSLLDNPGKVRKAFFYWTTRESPKAFAELMDEIYHREKEDNRIEIRQFITTLKHDDRNFGNVLFRYAADAVHARSGVDVFLGHRASKPHGIGRPKWDDELRMVAKTAKHLDVEQCGVFFCGPEPMAHAIRKSCKTVSKGGNDKVHMFFSKETF